MTQQAPKHVPIFGGQISVEMQLGPRTAEWEACSTGLEDFETACEKARRVWRALFSERGGSSGKRFKVRICQTPFGLVLAECNRRGAVCLTSQARAAIAKAQGG